MVDSPQEQEPPPSQRARTDVLWTDLVDDRTIKSKDELKTAYATAQPYPHGRLEHLFEADFLASVLDEIKTNSQVNFKESDLFRVYQSIDLGNVKVDDPSNQEKLPHTLQLRQLLYSSEWRHFMEELAGLPENTLTEQVDCAFNCHTQGCHLLCHDDVIGTRKISYILYLTDPDVDWDEEQGGALELYDSKETAGGGVRVPNCIPSKMILPLFNRMAFFEVKPGMSFHAVQEVLGERPRLSLQGWYHAKDVPEDSNIATLSQLKQTTSSETTSPYYSPIIPPLLAESEEAKEDKIEDLLKTDRDYLSSYIESTYLNQESIESIRKRFEENSSVQLRSFLLPVWADRIKEATQDDQTCPNKYDNGADADDWEIVGPSHKQRLLEYNAAKNDEDEAAVTTTNNSHTPIPTGTGPVLSQLRNVMQSAAFARYVRHLTTLTATGYTGHIRRFRPGLDYTVAHYGLLQEKAVLDATLCFVAGRGEDIAETEHPLEADVAWQSGDVGGFECYIEAEDVDDKDDGGGAAAAEYNQDDDTELLSVSASNNTLSIVYRDPGTMRFVKYVGSQAPSSRYDIAMEYECKDDEDEDEDEEGSKDANPAGAAECS